MHWDHNSLKALYDIFQIQPTNQELYEKALTHSSFTKENELNILNSYERLEFLGDAVLKLCISDILFKLFPDYQEGELTKIRSIVISDAVLAKITTQIGLDKLIILGKQEEKMGGRRRKSILACAFESVLGAYYVEGNFKELSIFLEKCMSEYIKEVDADFDKFNAKATLQEYTQSLSKETPNYKIVQELGPQHNKTFVIEVSYQGKILASGKGQTKKEAEQAAAHSACEKLGIIKLFEG